MKIDGKYLFVVVAMCGLSMATVGLLTNVAGLFFTPMAEDFGVLVGSASLTLTIANICVALGGLATRKLTKTVQLRLMVMVATAIMAGSTFLMSLAPNMAFEYVLSATRGLAGGTIGFVLITYVLNKWFVAQLGLATSIAMGFSGLAGALFTPIIQPVVEGSGWRTGMVLVAALQVALCLPAILLVPSTDPVDVGMRPFGLADNKETVSAHHDKTKPVKIDKLVYAGVVCYAVLSAASTAMPQHFPGYAAEIGMAAATGAGMLSACMLANTAGKIVMGWLTDHIGALKSIIIYTALVAGAAVVLLLMRVPILLIAGAFFYGLCYGRATVGLTMMCRELFGKRGSGIVYPVAALGTSVSNAILSAALGYAYDLTGSYAPSLIVLVVLLLASFALTLWCYRRAVMGTGQAE
jgi:predicted MFS family arabinose efflux permease